jgi:hypothetical protein
MPTRPNSKNVPSTVSPVVRRISLFLLTGATVRANVRIRLNRQLQAVQSRIRLGARTAHLQRVIRS